MLRTSTRAVVLLLLLASAAGARVRLDGTGGDAWTFRKEVTGEADAACERVEVRVERAAAGDAAAKGLPLTGPLPDGVERAATGDAVAKGLPPGGPLADGVEVVEAKREGRRFRATVPLAPGANEVVARCGGEQSSPLTWNVPLRAAPVARIRPTVDRGVVRFDGRLSKPAEADGAKLVRWRWSARASNPEALPPLPGAREVALTAPSADGEYYVALEVTDTAGRTDRAETYFVVRDGVAAVPDFEREHPAWLDTAVVYGVVPFLFGPRGLDDVRPRLDALRAMGVDTLWLSPILDAPDDDFGYAVTNYFAVRPAYGTRAALRRLVDDAHARGMRVVLDFVPNHTSHRHPYFEHAQKHGRASPYWGWYERDGGGDPEHYFDWEHLPNLDYDHPEVRRFMREAFAWWVRELDVDGFRVDVAWGVQQRAPEFWPALRRELKRIKPDVALIAEGSARDAALFANGFDAAYDWTHEPGRWAWGEAFAESPPDLDALRAALATPPVADALTMRFFDNNDTGERFVTRHGPGVERVAAALVFTLPGIPSLYTGVEAGAEYEPYDQLEPLDLSKRAPIADTLTRLSALRRAEPALTRGALRLLPAAPSEAVVAYVREGAGRPVLVALNFGPEPVRAEIPAPAALRGRLTDVLDRGAPVTTRRGKLVVPLPAHGARVLAPR